MKNLKVSMKLIVSFLIVALMTAIVGVVGIVGMQMIDDGATEMYEMQTVPIPYMAYILEDLQKLRVNVREFYIAASDGDTRQIELLQSDVNGVKAHVTGYLNLYADTIIVEEARVLFNDARGLLNGSYAPHLDRVYEYALAGDTQAIRNDIAAVSDIYTAIVTDFARLLGMKVDTAGSTSENNTRIANTMLGVIIAVLVLGIAVSVFFAQYISRLISKPLVPLAAFMQKAGVEGDLTLSREDAAFFAEVGQGSDEIALAVAAAVAFINRITQVSDLLTAIANSDLTHSIQLLSDRDIMGTALTNMLESLNKMFGEINASTSQVSMGSKQVADGAQALAQGSTEQAASVEELSSSINEIAEKTKRNADRAERAASLADTIRGNAEKGSRQMDEMVTAVNDINEASGQISRVIKVIDDIAFQTNILALNAAVEAARAGEHGKGFAVVAEEVRNLAAKSAEAAKDTSGMIENSIEKANLGVQIAGETAESLTEIVSGISESSEIVGEIARSSEESSIAIGQINIGIDQVAQVVQQNSATAQESAAASEEMSGQSDMLRQLISQFRLRDVAGVFRGLSSGEQAAQSRLALPLEAGIIPADGYGSGFDKY